MGVGRVLFVVSLRKLHLNDIHETQFVNVLEKIFHSIFLQRLNGVPGASGHFAVQSVRVESVIGADGVLSRVTAQSLQTATIALETAWRVNPALSTSAVITAQLRWQEKDFAQLGLATEIPVLRVRKLIPGCVCTIETSQSCNRPCNLSRVINAGPPTSNSLNQYVFYMFKLCSF